MYPICTHYIYIYTHTTYTQYKCMYMICTYTLASMYSYLPHAIYSICDVASDLILKSQVLLLDLSRAMHPTYLGA